MSVFTHIGGGAAVGGAAARGGILALADGHEAHHADHNLITISVRIGRDSYPHIG